MAHLVSQWVGHPCMHQHSIGLGNREDGALRVEVSLKLSKLFTHKNRPLTIWSFLAMVAS